MGFISRHAGFQRQRVERYQFHAGESLHDFVLLTLKQGDVINDVFIRDERPSDRASFGEISLLDENGDEIFNTTNNQKFTRSSASKAEDTNTGEYNPGLFDEVLRNIILNYTPKTKKELEAVAKRHNDTSYKSGSYNTDTSYSSKETVVGPTIKTGGPDTGFGASVVGPSLVEDGGTTGPVNALGPVITLELQYTPYFLYD